MYLLAYGDSTVEEVREASMFPTFGVSDRVLVNKFVYRFAN